MAVPYYNSSYGNGLEGVMSYSDSLVDGWFSLLFLAAMWIIMTVGLSKSEWKLPGVMAFTSFITLLIAEIMKLFMQVSDKTIFILIIMTAGFAAWSVIDNNKR